MAMRPRRQALSTLLYTALEAATTTAAVNRHKSLTKCQAASRWQFYCNSLQNTKLQVLHELLCKCWRRMSLQCHSQAIEVPW